jgi:hypothetical protein
VTELTDRWRAGTFQPALARAADRRRRGYAAPSRANH